DLVQLPANHRGLYKLLTDKAEREYEIPGTLRRHVAAETMRGWLRDYRRGGFDALLPKVRSDLGAARTIPPRVVDLLCELKDQESELSIPLLIQKARRDHASLVTDEVELPLSTVHRLLSRKGLMNKRKDDGTSKDRRRFEYDEANELWMSDVMYGPKLRAHGRLRQTYLIAFIDDATRLIPHATFALSERTTAYLPALEQALRRRGIPKRLYVDNGAAFRSQHLALVCAKLGIALIHARPYAPQGKGKMERWFRTVRMQLMPLIEAAAPLSLDTMNRKLAAWVEGEYHHAPHRGLGGETPADRWARISEHVKMPGSEVGECFLFDQKRRVARDRTVTLDGVAFEVDAALVGQSVTLRYDPARAPNKRTVEVWHAGKRIEIARRLDALSNCFVRRNKTRDALELDGDVTAYVPEGNAMRNLDDGDDDGSDF
ncbi:MAG TPA: DDE-type integrase/transposase/recombinase, partial [Polyangiaceae bacterium]|nr:DDE-type integrase/transposase/recombinase [Polyangiaceae bacterium]